MIKIINYGMGNIGSLSKAFKRVGVNSEVVSDLENIRETDKIILPGVGHFGRAMVNLKSQDLIQPLNYLVNSRKIPIFGICLGMQLFAKGSEECNCEGLGWIDADVKKIEVTDSLKVPHMGWNIIRNKKESEIIKNSDYNSSTSFYFVHSYYMDCYDKESILFTTNYDFEFCSGVEKDNIFGVQFHPEKSHKSGLSLIKSFATSA